MQGGSEGIWIYAAQRTTNVGRDHPFVVCLTLSEYSASHLYVPVWIYERKYCIETRIGLDSDDLKRGALRCGPRRDANVHTVLSVT